FIDLFLDFRSVEPAEGKSVDGKNIALVFAQPALEVEQGRAVAQFQGGALAEAQADGVRLIGTYPFPHAKGIVFERLESLRPRLAAVDIRAVGKMQTRVEFHRMRRA